MSRYTIIKYSIPLLLALSIGSAVSADVYLDSKGRYVDAEDNKVLSNHLTQFYSQPSSAGQHLEQSSFDKYVGDNPMNSSRGRSYEYSDFRSKAGITSAHGIGGLEYTRWNSLRVDMMNSIPAAERSAFGNLFSMNSEDGLDRAFSMAMAHYETLQDMMNGYGPSVRDAYLALSFANDDTAFLKNNYKTTNYTVAMNKARQELSRMSSPLPGASMLSYQVPIRYYFHTLKENIGNEAVCTYTAGVGTDVKQVCPRVENILEEDRRAFAMVKGSLDRSFESEPLQSMHYDRLRGNSVDGLKMSNGRIVPQTELPGMVSNPGRFTDAYSR